MYKAYITLGILLFADAAVADDQSVIHAYAMCRAIDNMGVASSPCVVSGYGQSVTATIDMSASEAMKFCNGAAAQIRQIGARFDKGWTLQIKSPYSGNNTTAYCGL